MNQFQKIIKEICEEENINFRILSKDWILMLEKNGITKFISGFKFDLNNHGLGNILDDKYSTYEVLSECQLPIIKHHILFRPTNNHSYAKGYNEYKRASQLYEKYNHNLVIKPNEGTCGKGVYHITKKEELTPCLDQLFQKNFSISICPFYKIKMEYRMIVLQNECKLMYGKRIPKILGDGKKTLKELFLDGYPHLKKETLKEEKYNQILKNKEVYNYNWKNNLSEGAIPEEVNEKTKHKLLEILNQLTKKISLGFCSVDIIETETHEFYILEINSGIMMNNYIKLIPDGEKIAKEIYHQAIKEMMNEK